MGGETIHGVERSGYPVFVSVLVSLYQCVLTLSVSSLLTSVCDLPHSIVHTLHLMIHFTPSLFSGRLRACLHPCPLFNVPIKPFVCPSMFPISLSLSVPPSVCMYRVYLVYVCPTLFVCLSLCFSLPARHTNQHVTIVHASLSLPLPPLGTSLSKIQFLFSRQHFLDSSLFSSRRSAADCFMCLPSPVGRQVNARPRPSSRSRLISAMKGSRRSQKAPPRIGVDMLPPASDRTDPAFRPRHIPDGSV